MKRSYDEFKSAVKAYLKKALAVWNLSDGDLDAYIEREEDEIKDGYERYKSGAFSNGRTDEACFKSEVAAVSHCLDMCYE